MTPLEALQCAHDNYAIEMRNLERRLAFVKHEMAYLSGEIRSITIKEVPLDAFQNP